MSEWKETQAGKTSINWEVKTVDEIKSTEPKSIISGPFGSNISSKFFVSEGIPVIRGNNLSLETGAKFIDDGFVFVSQEKAQELGAWAIKDDLIFTAAGTIGQVGLLTGTERFSKYIISNKQLRVRLNKSLVDPRFAYYWFSSPQMIDTIKQRDTGSTIPLINLTVLKGLEIPLPPLPEQRAIAGALSSLDDKIDLLHRQNKTLEGMAEALWRKMFVEEADPDWKRTSVSEIIEVRDGTHDSPKQTENGFHLITSRHLKNEGIDFATAYKISEEDYSQINKRSKVEKNDLLFSMIGTLGSIHYVDEEPQFAIKNIGLFKTSQKPEFAKYLYLLLGSSAGKDFVFENADGSTQEYISLGSLRSFTFLYPGDLIMKRFDDLVEPYFTKIFRNKTQIRSISRMRDTLLPKLMTGEVGVMA